MPDPAVLTQTGSGQTSVAAGSSLVTQVARILGVQGNQDARAQASDCINRVRIEMNQHDWRFMKHTQNPITLVSGTGTYSLDSSFRKPSYAGYVDASGIKRIDLELVDDAKFSHLQAHQDDQGDGIYYILRNEYDDGYVTVYPTPNADTASSSRLVVEYFARIGQIADSSATIALPEEAQNLLVTGGQAFFMRERDKANPITAQLYGDFLRMKSMLLTNDRRYTDQRDRFALKRRRTMFPGTLYIKVS